MNRHHLTTLQLTVTAMFAALTLLATSVIRIQTPTFGYIHLGDGIVLLAGIFLGPVPGGLAAGLGSALSDLLAGYAIWVPGTFVIKYLTAAAAGTVCRALILHRSKKQPAAVSGSGSGIEKKNSPFPAAAVIQAGIAGEAVMILGYFLYNILIVAFTAGSFTTAGLAAAFTVSLSEIPFNAVQGSAGILLAVLLAPMLAVVPALRSFRGKTAPL